jgi:hypothetical protein
VGLQVRCYSGVAEKNQGEDKTSLNKEDKTSLDEEDKNKVKIHFLFIILLTNFLVSPSPYFHQFLAH